MKTRLLCLGLIIGALRVLNAEDLLDKLDESLALSTYHEQVRARLSGLLDLEYYHFQQPPPGLIRAGGNDLLNPRLSLFLDSQLGAHVYLFAESRVDTAFDPTDRGAGVRLDEYALRITPWSDGRFSLQVGKFSTVVGSWVQRHLSWENPFINAPLPYETVTRVSDTILPLTGHTFRGTPGSEKYEFLPIIWGPVYAQGFSIAGEIGKLAYAMELKNAPLASRPGNWNNSDFTHPSVNLRVGVRPNEAWNLGLSAAEGPYLQDAKPAAIDGNPDNYRQYLLGQDISYARGHLQLWAEIFEARFEVPRLGDSDVLAYYLEAEYAVTPQLFAALRWNQEMFATGRDDAGESIAKAHDIWRAEAAVTYRFTAHTQLKLQYSLAAGDFVSERLNGTLAAQFTIRF